jgi:hypothetical protein
MPIHDWSRVEAGIFHDFHQSWTIGIRDALNGGALPGDYFALAEQVVSGPIPDVVTLQSRSPYSPTSHGNGAGESGGLAVADAPPRARFTTSAPADPYAATANRIVIRHRLGRVVAVIEIVSPGNKESQNALRAFVEKAYEFLLGGINLLVVDLFPPSRRDPQGIHQAIWAQLTDEPFEPPADKPLTVVAYRAGVMNDAYVDPIAVGDQLPSPPIFLNQHIYVPAPLESTYQLTWSKCPRIVREMIENPAK